MKKITILIKNMQYEELTKRASQIETTISEQIRRAIDEYLKKEGYACIYKLDR